MFESVPDKIKILIIEPLLKFNTADYKVIRKTFQEKISKDKKKFFDMMTKNLDWFLNLENKYLFESELYKKYPETHRQYFHEYHKVLQEIAKLAFDIEYISDSIKYGDLYDIYLESEQKIRYYDIKFYQFRESINKTKEKIENIIRKTLRRDVKGPTYSSNVDGFPHWSTLDFRLESGINCTFDFMENNPKIPHNHIYFTTLLIIDKTKRNAWQEGNSKEIVLIKKILSEILQIDTIEIINTYKLPEDFKQELFNLSIKGRFNYIQDLKIKEEIETRYMQIFTLASNELYLLASIIMGTILEQLPRIYYDSSEYTFSRLIVKARENKIISRTEHDLLRILEHIRNYIHIHVYIESDDIINKKKFDGSFHIFEESLDKLRAQIISKSRIL